MEEDYVMIPGSGTKKIIRDVKKEIETAFLDYSMSVIVARALPDVRDGLKPVHRRILYTMHERGNDPSHAYRKSADTVGAVLGSYHPHGDSSVYDAMVRLAQDFSLRYPLVDGQGNFGSVDGDPPAAYRYTEARMSKMAVEMLTDIDKDTINWDPNFDETKKEPSVLPSRFPNLLVNGSQGIAVGMATNIPPHNLGEAIDATCLMIDNPDCTTEDLLTAMPGPDFPTGGLIMGKKGILDAYETGHGNLTIRAKCEIEEKKNGRASIVVKEIPYQVNRKRLLEKLGELVRDKKLPEISNIHDAADRKGIDIIIDLKSNAIPQVVLNKLFKHTQLQVGFGCNMLALVNGTPRVLSLKEILFYYIEHQKDVVTRRTRYELAKAEEREHILEGYIIALDNIDAVSYTHLDVYKRQHGNRKLGTLNILLNDNKLVDFEHTLDGISDSFFAFHDVNTQSAAFGSRFHDTGSAHSQCKLLNGIPLSLLDVLIGSSRNAFALVKELGLGLIHRRRA